MAEDDHSANDPQSTVSTDTSLALDTLPELEKFIDVDEAVLADDYTDDVAGSSELERTAKYCRDCHVASQRLYHVDALSRVCTSLEDEHSFPIDLITELAEDDDNDVRRSIAMQMDAFASCLARFSDRLDQLNAIKLLGVTFMLVEDDCEEVIEAA
jgi:serine/threonine-protein phosphatase 4 regulatory subunit 1